MEEIIRQKLAILPEHPGCYIMRGEHGEILYIGKSKNLKNRVRSYFTGKHRGKTARLVHYIRDLEIILTDSEKEALLLEMTLIQKYLPPYNIRLKDGTSYLYIKITHEKNPHLIVTREVEQDGGRYFGPYPSGFAAEETKELLQKIYPLCHCSGKPGRPCFYFHLGQCIGPCDHEVSEETYQRQIRRISKFLNGGHLEVKQKLLQKMRREIDQLAFERAKETHKLILAIEKTIEKQKMLTTDFREKDIFAFREKDGYLAVQIFFVRGGAVNGRDGAVFEYVGSQEEAQLSFISHFYSEPNHLIPKEVLLETGFSTKLLEETLPTKIRVPKRGEKKALVDLVGENAANALEAHFKLLAFAEDKLQEQ
ncbi:excinuclease ABC subunit UvrC [Listeria costaricensis]|uniref:excinuclease ABC subunit UvrC n=1 Tax=Listeria costaricensis TaxID=2026604 RepID=UPI000C068687|nr:excinuclease ABC subunit UvrC [Listeria costaricensis]